MRFFRRFDDIDEHWETAELDHKEVTKIRERVIEEAIEIEKLIVAKAPNANEQLKEVLRFKLIPAFESVREDYAEIQAHKELEKNKTK